MPILRARTRDLSPEERADLEAALRDPSRFHNDGRAVGVAAIVVPLFLAPLAAILASMARSSWSVYGNPLHSFIELFPRSLTWLVIGDLAPYSGLVAIAVVTVAIVSYALRTRGRHGVAITSFALVRIRGQKLRVLRWEEVGEVSQRAHRGAPSDIRVITNELNVKPKDGKGEITLYGFGLGPKQGLIEGLRNAAQARATLPGQVRRLMPSPSEADESG